MKTSSKRQAYSAFIVVVPAIMVLCALLLSAGCQAPDNAQQSSDNAQQSSDVSSAPASAPAPTTLAQIQERGVLRVGTAGDYQPMSYLDPETGRYVGFDAELAEDLAASLGVDIEYVETSWPTLMDDTLAGKFDLAICGITVTDARKEQALMSDGYLGNGKTVLCRAEDAGTYTSIEAINRPEVRMARWAAAV